MPGTQEAANAMGRRSVRNIQTELEFLEDSGLITQQQLSAIMSQLPDSTTMRVPISAPTPAPPAAATPQPTPVPVVAAPSPSPQPYNEKQNHSASPAPPAYPGSGPGGPPPLATATSLYPYNPTDAGDLALLPNDRVSVLEYVNAEWWKGRNERTGQEGIFPRNYVKVAEEKGVSSPASYGNMPVAVAHGNGAGASTAAVPAGSQSPSKFEQGGKKFGKKMGNAAIFGAGATVGSKIVNGIF